MKPLSIAVVRQRFVRDGGAERFVARMLEALQGRDVDITLITRRWEKAGGARVVIVDPFCAGRLWRDWSFARAVRRFLETRAFDIVQSHERIAGCDIYRAGDGVHREWLRQRARTLGRAGRLGLALSPYHAYVKAAEKAVFLDPRLRAVICNSRMVRDEVGRHFRLPHDKLPVIYSGVDTAVYHPGLKIHRAEIRARHDIPEDATLFLFVGSGFERKGLAALLRAMAGLPENAFLLVIGRDKHAGRFRRRARALGLARRVRLVGAQTDVKPYYGAADALVLPTLYDPFPNAVLEAMACGLPVVTSLQCGAAELIENGRNGFVCDALDIEGQTGHLRALLDAQARQRMGAAARKAVEPLTLAAMSERLVRLYRELAATA